MLDGAVIGSKMMYVVIPDSVYFVKNTLDVVYGSTNALPIAAMYEGKQVAISPADVIFTLDNAKAGTFDGFNFIAAEDSGVKSVKLTAVLAQNDEVSGTASIKLYRQGENSFDFDKATGGDRLLAWDRVVSNAVTEDGMSYVVVDTDKDMTTSYTFAMDMTQIPMPERLTDLIYMLPGADMENASAWNFLLQLAERISVLSNVTPVLKFDPNVNVDYSEMVIKTDYFELTGTHLDEATNTLTLTLHWIDQTAAIDPATANSLCMVSGIKLTPKDDANWDANKRLNLVHSGYISYEIYMRANALYSFAQKPENQEIYGLTPFENPNLPSERGASFSSIYKEFEDSYTLINSLKNGWYAEDGGFAYYKQGIKLSGGVKEADGYWYYFDENGINIGQQKYTGLFFDTSKNSYYYVKNGTMETGWQSIDGAWYYFVPSTGKAISGTQKLGTITYEFEENGKLKAGVWANVVAGWRYYYGPSYHWQRWLNVDGKWYYFENGLCLTGYHEVIDMYDSYIYRWFDFGTDGAAQNLPYDGLYEINGDLYYMEDGISAYGLTKVGDDYYYFSYAGPAVRNQEQYANEINCDLPAKTYTFGADGKMLNGLVQKEDGLYYYDMGRINWELAGLHKIDGYYYCLNTSGKCVTGEGKPWATFCDLPTGTYQFGADGKMLNGLVQKEDGYYIYFNGKIDWEKAGLHKIGDDYYCINTSGKCITGTYNAWATFCDLPTGTYEFGADGKMLRGIVAKDGAYYYYTNGKLDLTKTGLQKVGNDYYLIDAEGKAVIGTAYAAVTGCDLPVGEYTFGADGKMLHGIVQRDDGDYYYINGQNVWTAAGLHKIGDDYYYIEATGKVASGRHYVLDSFCDLPAGIYEFAADGKMLNGVVAKADGYYWYVNGQIDWKAAGLYEIDGYYYFITTTGKCVTGNYVAWATYCDLPVGTYEFAADGKMLHGFVEKEDGLYVYVDGKPGSENPGLTKIGDYYYCVDETGKCVTGVYTATATHCDLPVGTYEFDAQGRMLNGFVTKTDGIYYYVNGKIGNEGINYVDGFYYYVTATGKLITNQTYRVVKTNGLIMEGSYQINANGQLVRIVE